MAGREGGQPVRLGFFGGTFDPPHRGHVAIARAAADRFALERVLWAPVGRQPLKGGGGQASFGDRLAMCALACEADPRFAVSGIDAPRADEGPNYTVDTLDRLRAEMADSMGGGAEIFCLAGADSFRGLAKWREPERLLELAEWIVVSRPGFVLEEPEGLTLRAGLRDRVHLLDAVEEDVSATELRRRLHLGLGLELGLDSGLDSGLACPELPPGVAEYITRHGLYGVKARSRAGTIRG